jgi:hypothetical protein
MATVPPQMSRIRTSVRGHDGFRWGFGGSSDIVPAV